MLQTRIKNPTYYAELKAYQELAWWATHYLAIIAHEHYGYSLEEIKPLEDAASSIWGFTWELSKKMVEEADSPEHKREALDVFYGSIQYWRQCGPTYWEKHAELDKAFDRLRRELL